MKNHGLGSWDAGGRHNRLSAECSTWNRKESAADFLLKMPVWMGRCTEWLTHRKEIAERSKKKAHMCWVCVLLVPP